MRGTSKNTINERICAIRYTLDLSQRKFGEVIGVGLGTVARMKKTSKNVQKKSLEENARERSERACSLYGTFDNLDSDKKKQ